MVSPESRCPCSICCVFGILLELEVTALYNCSLCILLNIYNVLSCSIERLWVWPYGGVKAGCPHTIPHSERCTCLEWFCVELSRPWNYRIQCRKGCHTRWAFLTQLLSVKQRSSFGFLAKSVVLFFFLMLVFGWNLDRNVGVDLWNKAKCHKDSIQYQNGWNGAQQLETS